MNNHELTHHGILGQKWGVQNGPPYPLAPGDHSASEKKAGWRKSLYNKDGSLSKKGFKANKKQNERYSKFHDKAYSDFQARNKQLIQDYKDANKANNINYLTEREKWAQNKGEYKNVDYYDFKDMTANKWLASQEGKIESRLRQDLEKAMQQYVKEYIENSKYGKRTYLSFGKDYEVSGQTYAEKFLKSAISSVRIETISNQKHRVGDLTKEDYETRDKFRERYGI